MTRVVTLYRALNIAARRTFWTIVSITSLLALFSISLIRSLVTAPTLLDFISAVAPFVLTVIGLVSAISILNNRLQLGAWLFFFSIVAAMLVIPFIQEGFAFPAAVLVLVVTILVPLQVFAGRITNITVVGGLTIAGIIILVDAFWPGARAGVNPQDLQNSQIATIGLSLILAVAIFVLYGSFNLSTKLLILTLGASFLSVIAVAGFASFFTQQALTQNTEERLRGAASRSVGAVEAYITFSRSILASETGLPIFQQFLIADLPDAAAMRDELSLTLRKLATRNANIESYALLDINGFIVMDTIRRNASGDESAADYFIVPTTTGQPYVSPVRFSADAKERVFYVAAPVFDDRRSQVVGVLRARYSAQALDEILKSNTSGAGEGAYPILLDEYNIIISDTHHPENVARPVGTLDAAVVTLLRSEQRLAELPDAELSLNLGDFSEGLQNYSVSDVFESNDAMFNGTVLVGVTPFSDATWKVAFVQPEAIAAAPLRQQTRAITLIALVTSLVLGISTLFISRSFTLPIERLTDAAEQLSAGNLKARANVTTRDELGTLATALNEMSDQLDQTLSGLEKTITARTSELEQQSQALAQRTKELESTTERSERRAAQLLAIAGVSNAIATIQDIEELLKRVTTVISAQFGFYHVGIFFNDDANKFAVLRAANSEGGQRMLARQHKLEIGATGMVGNVAASGRARIALDTGADAVFFNNPDLPATRSEMAIPLTSGSNVIGVLDVQSLERDAFSNEDVGILSILGDQVSIAIRNAQLFEESRRAASETSTLLQQFAQDQWQRVAKAQRAAGYRYDGGQISALEESAPGGTAQEVVTIPINVRGQTIGKLGIRPPRDYKLSRDEVDIIGAVVERLAISAENARLLQDSQERAAKEQRISAITSRIGASINMRSVLQTAVEELGRAMPGSEVVLQLSSLADKKQE